MLKDIAHLYAHAGRYARACPLPFLVPVAFEGLQHGVEGRLGMYAGRAAAHAVANDPWRIGFGSLKVLALLIAGYWVVRWFAWGQARRVTAWDAAAARRFAPLFAWSATLALATLWAQALGGPALRHAAAFASIATIPLGLLFSHWSAAAPLGLRSGPIMSTRIMARHLPWAFAVTLAAVLPPMVVHYALNYLAMGRPAAPATAILAADALFVGYQIAVLSGTPYLIALHATGGGRLTAERPAQGAGKAARAGIDQRAAEA